MNDELYDQLEQAMTEAENAKRDAFEESIRRRKAEKDAIDAKRRVNFTFFVSELVSKYHILWMQSYRFSLLYYILY